jgi:LmbE family N-acetylglucosaminyl deacetylase
MKNSAAVLVLVAHPSEETTGFSSVCAGADVVSVTGGSQGRRAEARAHGFQSACELLGAQRALCLDLPNISPWRLPVDVIADRLRGLGPYDRVYTHSPFEAHLHQRDVALAASQCFEEVWVRSLGGYTAEAHVLNRQAYQRKLEIINTVYPHDIALFNGDQHPSAADILAHITGIESFVPTRQSEVYQALALTNPEIRADLPDVWAFEVSAYEMERYQRTCDVLAQGCQERPPESILELGACEGVMSLRLRHLFPAAKVWAVESHPIFVRRLQERLRQESNISVVEASVDEIPLSADLIVMAEMLYYVPEPVMNVLSRLQAHYLLTSYHGTFDAWVQRGLQALGWREHLQAEVLPRFEPVDGRDSFLMAQRPGSRIRLWRPG